MNPSPIVLASTGSYLPKRKVSNEDLSKIVDTSHDWIYSRTGICYRHIADKAETTSDMAVEAAAKALETSNISRDDIDLLIVATVTSDHIFPSTACYVQKKLGLGNIPAFDLSAACSGFLYALQTGAGWLQFSPYKQALIIGAEKFSSLLNWHDRTTCVLFGDGAGAAVLSKTTQKGFRVMDTLLGADGHFTDILCVPAGGTALPYTYQSINKNLQYLTMNGKEVFKQAVRTMENQIRTLLIKHDLTPENIKLYIPHQANMRIIEALAKAFNQPLSKFFTNLESYGNTSAASIPIALDEATKNIEWHAGDYAVLVAFGAGLTWGATLLQYS